MAVSDADSALWFRLITAICNASVLRKSTTTYLNSYSVELGI